MQQNKNIRRFIVLGSARTGSSFLLSLLSKHPSIKLYGELFNLGKLRRDDLLEALEDPIQYLRKRVYKIPPPNIAAVGFKMFYYHLTRDYFEKLIDPSEASETMQNKFLQFSSYIDAHYEWSALYQKFRDTWDFLISDRSLSVIHLTRRNILNTLISHKTAFMTNQWMSVKGDRQAKTPLHLDPEECRRYFDKIQTLAQEADAAFAAHRKIELVYEDLVAAREPQLRSIFAFLDIPCMSVSTIMKKQIRAPAHEIVENYSQLKESFRHTEWNSFFE